MLQKSRFLCHEEELLSTSRVEAVSKSGKVIWRGYGLKNHPYLSQARPKVPLMVDLLINKNLGFSRTKKKTVCWPASLYRKTS